MISKKELMNMILVVPTGLIVVNELGIITNANDLAKRFFKKDGQELIGNEIEKIAPNIKQHLVSKSHSTELKKIIKVKGKELFVYYIPVFDENNKIASTHIIFKDLNKLVEIINEVTRIEETNYMLEAIIDSIQDAVSVVDEKGNAILINKAYTDLVGLTEKDVIGKPGTADIVKGKSVHMEVLRTGAEVKGFPLKVGLNKKDVIISGSPIIINGKLKGSMAIARDTSKIEMLTKKLNQMRQRIKDLESKYTFDNILGESIQLEKTKQLAKNVAATDATVLLRGESGTGKELFAHAIHEASSRKHNRFIRVNCSALTDSLISSELFGYEDGAFTGGKHGGQKGLFEEADGGTIFLDEVGELSLSHQAMLLRVLNEKEIIRVGGTKTIPVDVRIIAATNVELEKAIENEEFREDLYYRLMVYPIHIPPLRHRKDDIPILVSHLIEKLNHEYGRSVKTISKDALETLQNYYWPGNVRELENIISRAMINISFKDTTIETRHLPPIHAKVKSLENEFLEKPIPNYKTLEEILNEVEKNVIEDALARVNGNRSKAADMLDISVRTLYYKIKEYNLS